MKFVPLINSFVSNTPLPPCDMVILNKVLDIILISAGPRMASKD